MPIAVSLSAASDEYAEDSFGRERVGADVFYVDLATTSSLQPLYSGRMAYQFRPVLEKCRVKLERVVA
jgi:hypothetical protein